MSLSEVEQIASVPRAFLNPGAGANFLSAPFARLKISAPNAFPALSRQSSRMELEAALIHRPIRPALFLTDRSSAYITKYLS